MIGSHLNSLVGNDDAAMHDLFSATWQLQRIYAMPMAALSQLVATLECHPTALEDLPLGQLLAMVGSTEVAR